MKIRCPHCGKEFDSAELYCPACGRAVPPNTPGQKKGQRIKISDHNTNDSGKSPIDRGEAGINKTLLGVVILLLMLLCAAIGYFWGSRPDKPEPPPNAPSAANSGETAAEMSGSTQDSGYERTETSAPTYGTTQSEQSKPQQSTHGQTKPEQSTHGQTKSEQSTHGQTKSEQSTHGQTAQAQADTDKVYTTPLDPGKTEEMVSQVTRNCDSIQSRIDSGQDSQKEHQGMTEYYYNGRLEMIHVPESASVNGYKEDYYYKDGVLIFSCYENHDSFKYYFMNEQLIRYIYCADKDDPRDAHSSDFGYSTYDFVQRGETVLGSSYYYLDIISKSSGKKVAETPAKVNMNMITSITASSWKSEPDYDQYHYPENMLDGDLTTAWCEDAKGDGIGETITVCFDRKCKITGLYIYAGYHKSMDLFDKNNVPIQIFVRGDDRSEVLTLNADMICQKLNFTTPMYTKHFALEIRKVRKGNKYDDTLITDIKFY